MSASYALASSVFKIDVVDHIPVLRPREEDFLVKQATELNRLVAILRKKKLYSIVLDLSGCVNISSEGLGMIAACWQWCQEKGRGRMGVVLPTEKGNEVVNLFDITGLTHAIGSALQRNAHDAVSYLKRFSPAAVHDRRRSAG